MKNLASNQSKVTFAPKKSSISTLPVYPSIDSYFFYIEADHRPFKSGMPDPILDFYTLYSKNTFNPTPISKQPYPLFSPSPGMIPQQYQVLQGGNYLTLKRRVPPRHHHILNSLNFLRNPQTAADWGKFMRELEEKLISAGMNRQEKKYFKAKYEFEIEGSEFLFKKTRKVKSPKKHDAFLASIGGMTSYEVGFKENIWNKLRWAQILLHHFQDDIRTYGIDIAFDIPCSIEEIVLKANLGKLEETRKEFGTTVYYYFTKAGEKIRLYCKTTKDGGYLPMTRLELVIPQSKIKCLGLYDLHRDPGKIKILVTHILKRLNQLSITHNSLPILFPSEDALTSMVSDFIRGLNGHSYNPCSYNLYQQNFADSCRVLTAALGAFKEVNEQEYLELELDLSLLGAEALKNRKKKLRTIAKISKEVFNKKVIPHMIGNYHRIAPLRDREMIEKIKKVNSIQAPKTGIYKLETGELIFIDTTIQDLITDDVSVELVKLKMKNIKKMAELAPQETAQVFTNNLPSLTWHGPFTLLNSKGQRVNSNFSLSSKNECIECTHFFRHSIYAGVSIEIFKKESSLTACST